jgi:hypothetical protein
MVSFCAASRKKNREIRGQEHVKKSTFGECRTHTQKNFAIRSSLSDLWHLAIHFLSENNLQKMGRINFFTASRRDWPEFPPRIPAVNLLMQ